MINPVSYTHLDVYKRQVLNGSHIVGHNEIVVQVFDDAQVEDALPGMNVADAVSYTHLDVYKRQAFPILPLAVMISYQMKRYAA